ncbi:hypothetical protein QYE76_017018 [Lolium multiflorum]|uniref:DUF4218 domain-containing protein n=1 Tax=Lolium multiflorum TaxID=4521 RepID=A0AAD8QHY8_LOLMU|nr:hypothetical protein QYE76_017018 [Lolium multiflorum]
MAKVALHGKEVFAVHRRTAKRPVHGKGQKAHGKGIFARQRTLCRGKHTAKPQRTAKSSLTLSTRASSTGRSTAINTRCCPATLSQHARRRLALPPSTRAAANAASPCTRGAAAACLPPRAPPPRCPHTRRRRLAPLRLPLLRLAAAASVRFLRRLAVPPARAASSCPRPAPPPLAPQPAHAASALPSSRKGTSATGPTPPHRLALLPAGSGAPRGLAAPMAAGCLGRCFEVDTGVGAARVSEGASRIFFEVDTGGGVAGVFEGASRIFFADSLTRQGYFEVDTNGDGQKRQTTVAKNILRYLPVLPRIQRLFMTEDTAQQMRWAVEGIRPDSGKMIHPSDGTAWKNFVKKYPLKAGDPRSVAIAISTDGFNPYGPKYPGKNMNVYLEPLIDDLLLGWEDRGIRTYDAAKKEHFDMYVWYHTSLHDLPARALFCGWCTHGKWPCPECRQAVTFFWLNKGGKYSCFDEARQFLEQSHEYRSDVKSFKKGRVVHAPKPIPKTGQETKAELDALQPNPDGNGFLGYGETHQWTHKPCFWKLPYFEFLELPHNIDVMHTEKNISEAIWSTIVDTEKTKDNIKARIDQEKLCDRPELNMQPPHGAKKTWTKPHAPFCLTKAQKREVFQWMKDSLFFPDGFAANWMRGLNIETLRVQGLKSHDYHVWLERIMPVMIRGYVPEKTWRVLARLSYFFRQICARELDTKVIEKLDEQAPMLLCDLEKIFPPAFFNPMQHMILHLAKECLKGGPNWGRWQFGPERETQKLRQMTGNKCKIEASIAEAVLNVEVANFTTKHYDPNIPTKHNPVLRYNAANNEDVPKLSIFIGLGGKSSGSKPYTTNLHERELIHSYVLNTMVEVKPYIK